MNNPNQLSNTEQQNDSYNQWQELEKIRYEHGDMGIKAPEPDLKNAMSREELISWQGENGEINRGMQENYGADLRGAMSHEELVSWQGENGEINRAGYYPTEAEMTAMRKEQMGTTSEDLAKITNRAMQLDYGNKESVENTLNTLMQDPTTIQKVIERRVRQAFSNFDSRKEYNQAKTFTDLTFIEGAAKRGMDLNNTEIDINFWLGGDPEMVSVADALDKMSLEYSKTNAVINNPDNPKETIKVTDYIRRIKESAAKQQINNALE